MVKTKIIRLVTLLAFLVSSFPQQSFAWWWDGAGPTTAEGKKLQSVEKGQQARSGKISVLMQKARDLRFQGNFKSARGHAQKALRVNPDDVDARLFLEQLDKEEVWYKGYQEALKSEEKSRKEQKKLDREKAKREKIQRGLDRKTSAILDKAEESLKKGNTRAAEKYARQVLGIDSGNARAKEILSGISAEARGKEAVTIPGEGAKAGGEAVTPLPVAKPAAPSGKYPIKRKAIGKDSELLMLSPGQPIVVDGDKVEYFEQEGKIVAEGNVSISYGDAVLRCDKIEVNTVTREAVCEGNVRVDKTEGVLTGDKIKYDFDKKEGEIIGGELKAYPFFGAAEETSKPGENEFLLRNGFITTCDHDRPHYRLKAREIRVFPNDKIVAKNVIAYVGNVPVMWIPYYYQPIIDWKAKVQFIPGVTGDWGYFLLSAWRMHIKGNTKADILLDYRSKKGFAEGFDLYYDMKDLNADGLGHGLLRTYFIEQNGWGTYEPTSYRDDDSSYQWRERIQWKHRIDFDPNTVGMMELNKLSDKWLLKDYFYNEYSETETVPPNYVSIISDQRNFTFSVEASRRINDFYTFVEKMPEVKVDVPAQRLWETPFYYNTETSAASFRKLYATEENERYEIANRADTFHKLSYVTGLGPLNVTPYADIRETVYSKRKYESEPAARMAVGGGVDTKVRFNRVYDFKTDVLGLDINKLRHVVAPSVGYFHTHQPTIDKDTLFQMDDIDAIEKQNGMTFAIENKLQTKKKGAAGDLIPTDFLRSIVSVDYFFSLRKNSMEMEENGDLRNLRSLLEVRPYNWLYLENELGIDPRREKINYMTIDTSLVPVDYFRLTGGYRYEDMYTDEPRNQLIIDTAFIFNPKWRFCIYERYDIEGQDFEEQQYTITRDLHCWEVDLTYDVKGSDFLSDDFTLWLAFRLKAFPELPIGLNRSYERRAPGAEQVVQQPPRY